MLSACGILVLLFPGMLIALLIVRDSRGGVFFRQKRLGKNFTPFYIFKFRTMVTDAERLGPKVSTGNDPRITKIGGCLRRYKLDEVPQLFNVFLGDMSLVGPRPEVEEYIDHYREEYRQILSVRPGITDQASIDYIDEDRLLEDAEDPEALYVGQILPAKLELNKNYVSNWSLLRDMQIILQTVWRIIRR